MIQNWTRSLAFVWRPEFDSPDQGYHVTPGDEGGGTFGGVIESTWARVGTPGVPLKEATRAELEVALKKAAWDPQCEILPPGIDLLLFNGRMASGRYPWIFQQTLGLLGPEVDGAIGPHTIQVVQQRCLTVEATRTLIYALVGHHDAYLRSLSSWPTFGGGWEHRQFEVLKEALTILAGTPTPPQTA